MATLMIYSISLLRKRDFILKNFKSFLKEIEKKLLTNENACGNINKLSDRQRQINNLDN